MGWAVVGIVIAAAWGIGNITSGMPILEAIAVPAVILAIIVGVIALALFNVPWFARLCTCDQPTHADDGESLPAHRQSTLRETRT
jgi:hypothetical protein